MSEPSKARPVKVACKNRNTELEAIPGKPSVACPECNSHIHLGVTITGKIKAVGGTIIPGSTSFRQIR